MAITLTVGKWGEDIKDDASPTLDGTFISSVEFACETTDNSKGRSASQSYKLTIEGSINYNLVDGVEHPLALISEWAKMPAENAETYRKVRVDVVASDQVVRRYEFPSAFVLAYGEDMDEGKGVGNFSLVLRQKADVDDIVIKAPFKVAGN